MRIIMKWGYLFFIVLICFSLCSCIRWRADYLQQVVNQATQDDITKRLGPPHFTRMLDSGEEVWTYQYSGVSGNQKTVSSYCSEYILTFDHNKILRNWVRQTC